MGWIRPPAVAGLFYPDHEATLRKTVQEFLEEGRLRAVSGVPAGEGLEKRVKALIAPHAGYVYSGPVAGSAYALLAPVRDSIQRVVLLGPAHRHAFRGLAAPTASAFQTPLGVVPLDVEALEEALKLPHVLSLDRAHEGEHSLEVHLPFLQMVLKGFRLVPLVVGDARPGEVAEILRALWGGPETLIVVSSDLSHFLSYDEAAELDELTARAIEELRSEAIGFDQACGRIPVAGLLLRVAEEGLEARRLDLRSSGDTAGPRNQVVGYGSWMFR